MNKQISLLLGCLFLLVACNSATQVSHQSTPPALRAIAVSNLTAVVTLNGSSTSYFGSDYPDGNWIFYLDLEVGREHDISVEWLNSGILVMEETGSFIVETVGSVVTPNLNYATTDDTSNRFDIDCDGLSNLEEMIAGSNPEQADGDTSGDCTYMVETPADPNAEPPTPRVGQLYRSFSESGYPNRISRFTQRIQVRNVNVNIGSAYGITLYTQGSLPPQITANMSLRYDPDLGKYVRLQVNNNYTVDPTSDSADCISFVTTTRCSTPYFWQEQKWYELVFEEIDSTTWSGSIIDLETGISTQLGTFETQANIQWYSHSLGQGFSTVFTAAECANGLPASTMHFYDGVANGEYSDWNPSQRAFEDCLRWGGGSNYSTRTVNGETINSLTLGRLN